MNVVKTPVAGETSLIKPIELALMLCLVIAVSLGAYSRNVKWNTRYSMWSDVVLNSAGKWRPYYRLGLIFYQGGRYETALSSLERAYKLKPDARGILNNIGLSYQRLRRTQEASRMYARAIESDDNPSVAYLNLGTLYLEQGELERALVNFNNAIRVDPANMVALVNAGFTYADMGKYAQAARLHKRAIKLNPYYANAHYGLAIALEGTRDIDGAIGEWRSYLRIGPKSGPWAERGAANIKRLRRLQTDVDKGQGR